MAKKNKNEYEEYRKQLKKEYDIKYGEYISKAKLADDYKMQIRKLTSDLNQTQKSLKEQLELNEKLKTMLDLTPDQLDMMKVKLNSSKKFNDLMNVYECIVDEFDTNHI